MTQRNRGIEGFTVPLALVDALPVLLFCGTMLCIRRFFPSTLFLVGALSMALGGLAKVAWKLLLGLKAGDVRWLNKAFVPLMAAGFLLALLSLALNLSKIRFAGVIAALVSFPSVLFFAAGLVLLAGMVLAARRFDRTNARDNWRAQCINAAAQAAFFLGMLLL